MNNLSMSEFDPKFEHLHNNYSGTNSDKHDIWQTFVENNILTYNEFVDSQTLEILKKMKRMKGNTSVDAFTDGKLILVYNALLTIISCLKMEKKRKGMILLYGTRMISGNGKAKAILKVLLPILHH